MKGLDDDMLVGKYATAQKCSHEYSYMLTK